MNMSYTDKNNILVNDILFEATKHANNRKSERKISQHQYIKYLSNLAESDDWNLWLNLHTKEDGAFDLYINNETKYPVYDPKTKLTSILYFPKINEKDSLNNIRRIKIISVWNGRPVGASKKNIKKNNFHNFKTSKKARNQINSLKVPYFHLIKGTKEAYV